MVRHVEFIGFCQCQVPAIWREVSKQFMGEKALQANLSAAIAA